MSGVEVIIGLVGCVACTLCGALTCLSLEERRRRQKGLPPAMCCSDGQGHDQGMSEEMLRDMQLQEHAMEEAERVDRMEAYIIREAKAAAENVMKAKATVSEPPRAASGITPAATQVPSQAHLSATTPMVFAYAPYFGQPMGIGPMMSPYQMPNQGMPYSGSPIYFLR
jgi:hypothetical protein